MSGCRATVLTAAECPGAPRRGTLAPVPLTESPMPGPLAPRSLAVPRSPAAPHSPARRPAPPASRSGPAVSAAPTLRHSDGPATLR